LGNKADIDEVDLLLTLAEDQETKVILGYLEGVSNGTRFMEVAKKVSRKKPVIITKSGRTQAGAKAASSHTGTLTGSDTAYEAAFRQCGVTELRQYKLFSITLLPLPINLFPEDQILLF